MAIKKIFIKSSHRQALGGQKDLGFAFRFCLDQGKMSFILFEQEFVYKDIQGQLKSGNPFQQSETNILRQDCSVFFFSLS